jgi:hypothetical protein
MSYFNNDHLQINNIIIDFEENISKISSFSQILNSIDNFDEFIDIRKQINTLFNDIENDTNTLINTLKIIQYNIRKLYDDFSLLQNNYEDIEEKLKMILNDNSLLLNKNKELNKQINYKNQVIDNQEKHINKLTEIIKINEKIMNELNSQKDMTNEKYNNNGSGNSHGKTSNKKMIKNKKYINSNKKNNYNKINYNLKKNNSATFKKSDSNKIINNDNNSNTIENYLNKNYDINLNYLNQYRENVNSNTSNTIENYSNIPSVDKYVTNSVNTGKYVFNDDLDTEQDINNNTNEDNTLAIKNRINKVEKIISIIYNNNNLYCKLKEKYGEDLDNKIIDQKVSSEFLDQILNDISNYTEQKDIDQIINSSYNRYAIKKNNNNEELNANFGKNDKNRRNKDIFNTLFNNDNSNNKLTNYFLFNLHREKMIDSQQRKENLRPKTPKI